MAKCPCSPKTLSSHVLAFLQDGEKGPSRKLSFLTGTVCLYFLTSMRNSIRTLPVETLKEQRLAQLNWANPNTSKLLACHSSMSSSRTFSSLGRIVGKRMTSRIDAESVKNITKRSIPIPSPPVGGSPYSRACTKSSSII